MKLLRRKDMPLYILLCENQTYIQFQDVFGKKIVDKLFINTIYEEVSKAKFADIAHSFFREDSNSDISTSNFGCKSVDELVKYIEWLLDMDDKGKPLHNGSYLFQYFIPRYENNRIVWGTRGHPFLYASIARQLSRIETKEVSEQRFIELFYDAYQKITGRQLVPGENYYIEELDPDFGGMSAGCVNSDWFISIIGILADRMTQKDFFEETECYENCNAKFIIMDSHGVDHLYIEYDDYTAVSYNFKEKKWVNGGNDLLDARVGFDESEPEGSPYRFGNPDCMYKLKEVSKEEAEAMVGCRIDPQQIKYEMINRYNLKIKKENYEICNLQDWEDYAGPVDKNQWRDKRSAKEFAKFILSGNGYIPIKLFETIRDYTKSNNYILYPEFLTGFKKYGMGGRGPRHHDGLLIGSDIVIGIEAKADEELDKHYLSEYDSKKNRYKVISKLIFGDKPENHPNIRYQLVSSAMGTLIEAVDRNKETAVLLIISFISKEATKPENVKRNKEDIKAFKNSLCKVAEDQYEVPFSKEHNIKFYIRTLDIDLDEEEYSKIQNINDK